MTSILGLGHPASITQKTIDSLDAIVGRRTQPSHRCDTGRIGTRLLLGIFRDKLSPTTADAHPVGITRRSGWVNVPRVRLVT